MKPEVRNAAIVAAVVLILAGAYHFMSSSPSASSSSSCKPFEPQPGDTIYLFGDSLGVGIAGPLKTMLAAAYPGVNFIAKPVTGYNASQTLSKQIAGQAVRGYSIVSLGSNDAAGNVASGGPAVRGVSSALAEGGPVLWILPPNFAISNPPLPATKEKQMLFIEQVQSDPRVDILVPSDAVVAHIYSGDHIHLEPAGYKLLAEQVVARMLCS